MTDKEGAPVNLRKPVLEDKRTTRSGRADSSLSANGYRYQLRDMDARDLAEPSS
jgi:hypothetical protein